MQTTSALLALQLGWGLWLFPADFARLGWVTAGAVLLTMAALTAYSGFLFTRLFAATPGAGVQPVASWHMPRHRVLPECIINRCVLMNEPLPSCPPSRSPLWGHRIQGGWECRPPGKTPPPLTVCCSPLLSLKCSASCASP